MRVVGKCIERQIGQLNSRQVIGVGNDPSREHQSLGLDATALHLAAQCLCRAVAGMAQP